jgi:hypothetical protein
VVVTLQADTNLLSQRTSAPATSGSR